MKVTSEQLQDAVAKLALDLSPKQMDAFEQLSHLLVKWNKAFNLLTLDSFENFLSKHLLDSLVILPYLEGDSVADVGTGAGFPGLPLAISKPDTRFTLVDSNIKKTRFVQQAIIELKLANVTVIHGRAEQIGEQLHESDKFDSVVSRAFSDLSDFVQKSCNICRDQGLFIAMKGRYPSSEIEALPAEYKLESVHQLEVPGLNAERCVVLIRNT